MVFHKVIAMRFIKSCEESYEFWVVCFEFEVFAG